MENLCGYYLRSGRMMPNEVMLPVLFAALKKEIGRYFVSKKKGTVLYLEASVLLEALPNSVNPILPISVKTL